MEVSLDPPAAERYAVELDAEPVKGLRRFFRLLWWWVLELAFLGWSGTPRERVVVRVHDKLTDSVAIEYEYDDRYEAAAHAAALRAEVSRSTASEFTASLNLRLPEPW
ncbi:MAG: hypothetical protein J2O46_00635 [Nocardioides sp.]|nr:hypothetical protein [Nocardioides sp.]